MTIKDIQTLNEEFQKSAAQLSELLPSSVLTEDTSLVIRSAKKINKKFVQLFSKLTEVRFYQIMDQLENETDEIISILDQIEMTNRKRKISLINDFLKEGYDLISIYYKYFDIVISERIVEE